MIRELVARLFRSGLLRATLVYGAVSAVNRAIPFLLIPVFTRFLTTRDYGTISMFAATLSITSAFNGFGVLNTVSLRYFQRDKIDLGTYVGNCIYVLLASSVLLAALLSCFAGPLEELTGLAPPWGWAVLVTSVAGFCGSMLLSLLQSSGQPLRFGAFQVSQTVANIAISLWLVILAGMGWRGRIHAQVIVAVVSGLLALYALRRSGWLRWGLNTAYIRDALSLGAPLLPHALAGFVMDATDRVLIKNMVSVEETGIYAVGSQIGMVMLMLTSSFNMAWVPWLFERLSLNDARWKQKIVLITYGYNAAVLSLALLLGGLAPWVFRHFVGPHFVAGSRFVIWVALGYAFNGMYMMVTNYLVYAERTALVAWATMSSALINVLASYLLIRHHGAVGAPQGAMLAHLCSFLLTWLLAARVFPMPWSLRRSDAAAHG